MPTKTQTTIGISLGGRYIGTAIMRDNELLDWRIKAIRARTEGDRIANLRRILSRIADSYHPNVVAVKTIHPSRSSPFIDQTVDEIRGFCSARSLLFKACSLTFIKNTLLKSNGGDKQKIAERLAEEYPVLHLYLNTLDDRKARYRMRLFEAIAAAKVSYVLDQ